MSYDNWKSTEPESLEPPPCDKCFDSGYRSAGIYAGEPDYCDCVVGDVTREEAENIRIAEQE